ncbi:DNA primase subunit pri2 [Mucor velutinosus]|uniref:DNA primase subunit pri2 n=1 Tax=Mucor velutinosus TaxID=708070 RepID=A0AAN7D7A6_9FUNG|nr:DNA primase subunit pri2 [Mucor velutinosus]
MDDDNTTHTNNNHKKRNSDITMDIDSDNMSQSDYTPSPRPAKRKVSMATRRHSRMLYLEKYGLNQPGWHTSGDDYDSNNSATPTDEDHGMDFTNEPEGIEAEAPTSPATFAPNTQAIVDNPVKRPVSIRNFVQNSTFQKRPARFIKPQKSEKNNDVPPAEFTEAHVLMEEYTEKVYMEGYLHKRNDLNSNGSSCGSKKWSLWYVELCGPVLTLWESESKGNKDVYPQYINITDSTVVNESRLTAETRPNLFSLNSAGANRFLLQAATREETHRWILAIRLSCFECSRIQEIYTKSFISRPQFSSILAAKKPNGTTITEGFVQVRFPGATGWKKFWAVVSNFKVEKRLFNKKTVPTNGQVMFFESRKAKYPMMTLENVVQAYTVYPESPKLINMATLFKLEGSLYKNKPNGRGQQLVSASSSALMMSSNTNELVQWLVGSFDAFKLYGRPATLLQDPKNPQSLNFAESIGLFLELDEVESVDADHGSTLLGSKKEFTALLQQKFLYGLPRPAIKTSSSAPERAAPAPPTPPQSTGLVNNRRLSNRSIIPGQSRSNPAYVQPTQLRTVTCASDVSDEDEEEEQASDSDSDASLYQLGSKPKKPLNTIDKSSLVKPITPNTSKSSSEISEVSPATIPATADLFLPPVTDMMIDDSFSNAILSHTNPRFQPSEKYPSDKTEEHASSTSESEGSSNHKPSVSMGTPFYAQQRSASMMQLSQPPQHPWPMFGSTGSVVMGDYPSSFYGHSNNNSANKWETSSVDPRMMAGGEQSYFSSRESVHPPRALYAGSTAGNEAEEEEEEDEDDNVPIGDNLITRDSLLHHAGSDRVSAKQVEHHARATGQPMIYVNTSKKMAPRVGLMGVISEKEREKKAGRSNTMDEQMMMRERMMLEQRQQQMMMMQQFMPPYNNGMMPMMMPMMDPRMMPMMDPRMMPAQPMMLYDPRMMAYMQQQQPYVSSPVVPSPSISSGSSIVNGPRYQQQQYYSNDSTASLNTERRGKQGSPRKATTAMSSAGSISNQSVRSTATITRYTHNTRRNANQH